MRLLFLILLLFVQSAFAQMCPCEFGKSGNVRRNELGIGLFSVMPEPGIYRSQRHPFIPLLPIGLYYKNHRDKISYRISAAYKSYRINDPSEIYYPSPAPNLLLAKAKFIELRAGPEKTIRYGRLRLYAAVDLLAAFGTSIGNDYRNPGNTYSFKYTMSYIGISTILGLNYRVNESLSLNFEPGLNLTRNYQNYKKDNRIYERSNLILNTLSLNFHF